jgi:hypothetical protein
VFIHDTGGDARVFLKYAPARKIRNISLFCDHFVTSRTEVSGSVCLSLESVTTIANSRDRNTNGPLRHERNITPQANSKIAKLCLRDVWANYAWRDFRNLDVAHRFTCRDIRCIAREPNFFGTWRNC